jgi:hypothetical protein
MAHFLASPPVRRLAVQGQMALKASGRRWCRVAPLGYRWSGKRDGRRFLAADERIRAIAEEIVSRHRAGESWHALATSLWLREGDDWSVYRVRHLHAAALDGTLFKYDYLLSAARAAIQSLGQRQAVRRRRRERLTTTLTFCEMLLRCARP